MNDNKQVRTVADCLKQEGYIPEYWLNENKLETDGLFSVHFNISDEKGKWLFTCRLSSDETTETQETQTSVIAHNKRRIPINQSEQEEKDLPDITPEKLPVPIKRQYIGHQAPIASGFTAFLIDQHSKYNTNILVDLREGSHITKQRKKEVFQSYFNRQIKFAEKHERTFSHSFAEIDYDDISDVFIPVHIEEERSMLSVPYFFFSNEFTRETSAVKEAVLKIAEEYLEYVNDLKEARYLPRGLPGMLNDKQFDVLWKCLMQGNFIKAKKADFISALSPHPLPRHFSPVKWLAVNQFGKANAYKLRSLLEVCGVNVDGRSTKKSDVSRCFIDVRGVPILLGNPKRDDFYQADLKKFRSMLE